MHLIEPDWNQNKEKEMITIEKLIEDQAEHNLRRNIESELRDVKSLIRNTFTADEGKEHMDAIISLEKLVFDYKIDKAVEEAKRDFVFKVTYS